MTDEAGYCLHVPSAQRTGVRAGHPFTALHIDALFTVVPLAHVNEPATVLPHAA